MIGNGKTSLALLPPWEVTLPEVLVKSAEAKWLHQKGLNWQTYSTEAYLGTTGAGRSIVGPVHWHERAEAVGEPTARLLAGVGLRPAPLTGAGLSTCGSVLCRADALLRYVPEIRASVEMLVRSVHVIESEGADYDCSFSDPAVPFSIFVSVPPHSARCQTLRSMEAVVHECMHLQLSAFEIHAPVVRPEVPALAWYSPWKREPRKLLGVLHGMYVFHVVAYVYSTLLKTGALTPEDASFAHRRLADIQRDLDEVRGVESSPGWTKEGALLVEGIQRRSATVPAGGERSVREPGSGDARSDGLAAERGEE